MKKIMRLMVLISIIGTAQANEIFLDRDFININSDSAILVRTSDSPTKVKIRMNVENSNDKISYKIKFKRLNKISEKETETFLVSCKKWTGFPEANGYRSNYCEMSMLSTLDDYKISSKFWLNKDITFTIKGN